jgi:ribonuclease R
LSNNTDSNTEDSKIDQGTEGNVDPHASREAENYENPIPSREFITEHLDNANGPMTHEELCDELGMNTDEHIEALRRRLIAMERDGQLISNRHRAYASIDKLDLVRATVQGHKDGFGFAVPIDGGPDMYLHNRQMRKVFAGDEVLVQPSGDNYRGKLEGHIVEVLQHNTHQLTGRLFSDGGVHFVLPDNPRLGHDVIIAAGDERNARGGQFVVVEITQQPGPKVKVSGRVIEVLGDHMAPGMEIDVAIRSHGIPHLWPTEVQRQGEAISSEVEEADKKHRVDLRKLPFVTIDGEDARDFDDAVYCEPKKSGGWRLYVAIADVSHYVQPQSPLDREAQERGNSVYFPDFVVPMLPESLSNGLCSLNPEVDRLCMVCEMTISDAGKVSGYKFYEGIIYSHARLTYTQVGQALAERDAPTGIASKIKRGLKKLVGAKVSPTGMRNKIKHVLGPVDELHNLYGALRKARTARGAIDFETTETRIEFDENRKIDQIVPVVRNDAHKLIEECMLAANVCAARFLEVHNLPALYRVHEGPGEEKLERLYEFLKEVGLSLPGERNKPSPSDYQTLLASIKDRPDAHLIQTVLLRSLKQAKYQPDNEGHFGLGYQAYAHFTSPIRRYPDLLVHRAIRHIVRSQVDTKHVVRVDGAPLLNKGDIYPYDLQSMLNFGAASSMTERRAEDATRDVTAWLKCEYLQDHVGDVFDGVITAVTGFGLFVELKDLYVEGLVHITSLPKDYYHFEPATHRLKGERTGQNFRLGDELVVRVADVNLDDRKVDFELEEVKTFARRNNAKKPAGKRGNGAASRGDKPRGEKRGESRGDKPRGDKPHGKKPSGKGRGAPKSGSRRPAAKKDGAGSGSNSESTGAPKKRNRSRGGRKRGPKKTD